MTMTAADLAGTEVITASGGPYIYDGPSDDPRFERVKIGVGRAQRPGIEAAFDSVAPADIEIPAKDSRIEVVKAPELRPGPWVGPWMLTTPDGRNTFHRIKRDAVKAGVTRLAIADWHEANGTPTI